MDSQITREDFIAYIRYLGWICYQMGTDLPIHDSDISTYKPSLDRLNSLRIGTRWALENPSATAEDNHKCWMDTKVSQGWKYGDTLDIEAKTHPSLVPYDELSPVEQRKDEMDLLMVRLANQLYEDIMKQ